MHGRQNYPLKPQGNGNWGYRKLLLGEAMQVRGQGVVVFVYEPKRQEMATANHHHLLVCSLSVRKHLIFESADCETGGYKQSASELPVRGLLGSQIMKELA
jgi:hypothetical protein